jgi:hypothetical protein
MRLSRAANAPPAPGTADAPCLSKSRSLVLFAVLLCLMLTEGRERSRAQATAEEYQVKAAFLFHFAELVDWPPDALAGRDNSLFICTFGSDPFQGALEAIVQGKTVANRVVRILHLTQPKDMQACQIVFFGKAQSKNIPTLVAVLQQAPVLTVGESPGFLEAGGMILFVLEKDKVRFEINLVAAESARLRIGSRLLILAENVMDKSRER